MLKISERSVQTCLSFVVATDGDPQQLMSCLQSIVDVGGGQYPLEIVVVDNASSDETALVLAEIADDVKVVRFDLRQSWDAALTSGVEATFNEYVMMLSSDVVLEAGCIEQLVNAMNDDANCGAISPTVAFGPHTTVSQPPASGTGVALLLRISTMANGGITEAKHVAAARVHLQQTNVNAPQTTMTEVAPAVTTAAALSPEISAPAANASTPALSSEVRVAIGATELATEGWAMPDAAYGGDLAARLQRPLPYETGSVDLVFTEHLLERLSLEQGIYLLSEIHRVLKRGGVARIAVPDLFATVLAYLKNWEAPEWVAHQPEIDSAAAMVNARLHNASSQYFYDENDLALRLRSVGFTTVYTAPWGQSAYESLCGRETRSDCRLILEAIR